jgi:CRP/FNR family transcriptional regulator
MIQRFVNAEWKLKIEKRKTVSLYKKGQLLFNEGNPVTGVYFIYSGKVKIFLNSPGGKVHITRLAGIGDIVGHRGFNYEKIYPASAAAIEDSSIGFIPIADFMEALDNNAPLFNELLFFFGEELKRAEYKLCSFSQMTVKQRLSEALLNIRRVFGEKKIGKMTVLDAVLSRQELADMTGASIEEIIRTISQLKKEGMIQTIEKNIGIKSDKKLLALIDGFPQFWK